MFFIFPAHRSTPPNPDLGAFVVAAGCFYFILRLIAFDCTFLSGQCDFLPVEKTFFGVFLFKFMEKLSFPLGDFF